LQTTIEAKEQVAGSVVNDIMRARHMDAVNRLRSELEKKQSFLREAEEEQNDEVVEEEDDDDDDDDEDDDEEEDKKSKPSTQEGLAGSGGTEAGDQQSEENDAASTAETNENGDSEQPEPINSSELDMLPDSTIINPDPTLDPASLEPDFESLQSLKNLQDDDDDDIDSLF